MLSCGLLTGLMMSIGSMYAKDPIQVQPLYQQQEEKYLTLSMKSKQSIIKKVITLTEHIEKKLNNFLTKTHNKENLSHQDFDSLKDFQEKIAFFKKKMKTKLDNLEKQSASEAEQDFSASRPARR